MFVRKLKLFLRKNTVSNWYSFCWLPTNFRFPFYVIVLAIFIILSGKARLLARSIHSWEYRTNILDQAWLGPFSKGAFLFSIFMYISSFWRDFNGVLISDQIALISLMVIWRINISNFFGQTVIMMIIHSEIKPPWKIENYVVKP